MDLSPGILFSGLIIGSLGLFIFMVGKRLTHPLYLALGLGMCVYPYFIGNVLLLWVITAACLIPIWLFRPHA